jgi:hypothetical protein
MNFRMRLSSRKFLLACASFAVGAVGFFTGRMDGGTYVALVTLILGVYGSASVADKRLNGGSAP